MFEKIDFWIDRLENGKQNILTQEQRFDVLAQQILGRVQSGDMVLLTGGADSEKIVQVKDRLENRLNGVTIVAGGFLETDAQVLQAARECKAAILIEQTGVSTHSKIQKSLFCLENFGRPVLGFVLV